ncbi:2-C-methyl-D-erythritol 2,4-cyclodiphosphate synthase [Desulfomonile tiedjei]|uniref:2-C-methyl-D-erythritol 2,4-cyclodiphosphate synthase n=1 Tax=Desulfomonile tiedjei (strain ATCC 49306 / DSM 6799 / DCB-1) TaxID=706587 RepID=I4C2L1_DESTA|nr:2-C-methyl-D-erythritol 2,4-cyclodiphosphate synthase [Desulfomonile tiedjei]AFM23802.1 2-C-methyl-D-erythritol 2,4-cyclodiphosphate synthase [Desulfomonile tiedjei DSM 6799]
MKIGQGFDSHRLVPGRRLVLGGQHIEYPLGLEGHSDADVVIHAVIDALLGAAGLGDIGMHFPDSDPAYKDASSVAMLETVAQAIDSLNFVIVNIDVTICAQAPKIGPVRHLMIGNLSAALKIDPDRINIKATTTEGLGFVGRGEGIAAFAVALLENNSPEKVDR